ncbi:multiple sugar transport system permease protein [Actinoplanes lutulentus]|uniref:Carbohydrate ABC transporter membrane protein 1 (CUT1 family) n=1 Tax=Actinoplanes lutulentus TaxID=1287878 RepID=A0A327ZGE2_9ACTN|nr:sugar ABC transporter permease [Actinoplanes lutulentus]MBB2947319.1 multiple sugar transport system permease protein [Actinoplanes lutulentus]RAK36594.1 carbohydrate ABC transporter membrane protein 1 (CUT1 family) [Actinoplanes lutulentus]
MTVLSTPPAKARPWRRYPASTFYLFAAPWILGFLALTVLPLAWALMISLTNFDGMAPTYRFVGFRNYVELFTDYPQALRSLWQTLLYTAVVVPLSVAGGLGLAILVNRRIRAVGLIRAVFFLPSVVPVVATAIMWRLVLNPDAGMLNGILGLVGIPSVSWLIDPYAFYSLVMVSLWGLGGGMVITLAALQDVPAELNEAATLDGANGWQVIRNVTIPMISPVLYFQIVTGVIAALQVLVQPLLLAQTSSIAMASAVPPSTHVYMVQVYQEFFTNNRFGFGSAMLWVFFLVIMLFTVVLQRSSRRWVHYQASSNED